MSLFDKFYNATDEAIKSLKKPVVKSRAKRLYYSAYDDAEEKKLNAQKRIDELRTKVECPDINTILDQRLDVEQCEKLQSMIREEYKAMFGKEMEVREIENEE